VLEKTHGQGVDLAIDCVGAQTIEQLLKATRVGGHIVALGILSEKPDLPVDIMQDIFYGGKTGELHVRPGQRISELMQRTVAGQVGAASLEVAVKMGEFMDEHDVHPLIGKVYDFEQAREALDETASPKQAGKIVVRV
jgi:NADPH:quinone reductase-like Zn-dependent oxidoreductase